MVSLIFVYCKVYIFHLYLKNIFSEESSNLSSLDEKNDFFSYPTTIWIADCFTGLV